jgi:small nuclear ribonucleoprotein (snRNP)-like protein
MRHSTEEKTFWMDRWRVDLFGQDRIKTFKGQLNDCKSTLNVVLSTATMYVSSPGIRIWVFSSWLTRIHSITTTCQEYIMKEMKDVMLKQNETILQQRNCESRRAKD